MHILRLERPLHCICNNEIIARSKMLQVCGSRKATQSRKRSYPSAALFERAEEMLK